MQKVDTAVITANWNGKKLLKPLLDSLKKQTYDGFVVIVADNNSSDGSVSYVKKNFPGVKVIEMKKNTGFTGANNAGFREAMKLSSVKYIVTLNNDTVVDKNWLKNLVKAAESGRKIGSCSSKVLYLHDKNIIDTVGIAPYRDGHAQSRGGLEKASKYDKKEEVFGASAVAALWKREALEKTGLFDNMFFMYQEEVDMAYRLRYAGYKAVYVPNAVVYHAHSASSRPFSPLKAYYSERNRLWLVFKNFPCTMIPGSIYYSLMRYIALARGAKKGKGAAARFAEKHSFFSVFAILLKAYAVGLLFLPLFIPKKIRIQYMRIKNRFWAGKVRKLFERFGVNAEKIALVR